MFDQDLLGLVKLMDISSEITLNNGVKIPILGLGTWQSRGEQSEKAVTWALEAGYRHIDTAMAYVNEKWIGKAIKKSRIERDELFITTKLWIWDFEPIKALKAINLSLEKLKLNYIDLYLVHWPAEGYLDIWKTMEQILAEGKTRAIGVSNFMVHHLDRIMSNANIIPAVNQVEFTPYHYNKELLDFCKKYEIKIEAYSPLTRGLKFDDPKLVKIATRYSKTAAQVLIRWGLQLGLIEIPKSTNKNHIIENSSVFDFKLSKADMNKLCSLNENLRVPGSKKHHELAEKYL